MKKIAFIVVCIVVFCFFTASLQSAPVPFTDTWFKLKVKGKGYSISGVPGLMEISKTSWSADAYLNLTWLIASDEYLFRIFMKDPNGTWGFISSNTFPPERIADNHEAVLVGNWQMIFVAGAAQYPTYSTILIKTKRDNSDVLQSASFSSLGCEATFTESGSTFGGGCTIKGKMVDVSELPFSPPPP